MANPLAPERVAMALGWTLEPTSMDPEGPDAWAPPGPHGPGTVLRDLPPLRELILALEPGPELDELLLEALYEPEVIARCIRPAYSTLAGAAHDLLAALEAREPRWLAGLERTPAWTAEARALDSDALGWSVRLLYGDGPGRDIDPVWRPTLPHAVALAALLAVAAREGS